MRFQQWAGRWISCTAFQVCDISSLDPSAEITCAHICHHWQLMVKISLFFYSILQVFPGTLNLRPQVWNSAVIYDTFLPATFLYHQPPCSAQHNFETLLIPVFSPLTRNSPGSRPILSYLHLRISFLPCLSAWPPHPSSALHTIHSSLSS